MTNTKLGFVNTLLVSLSLFLASYMALVTVAHFIPACKKRKKKREREKKIKQE